MTMLQQRPHSGPITSPRIEKLWTWSDPLHYRPAMRYEFEMEIFDAHELLAKSMVLINGKIFHEGTTYCDVSVFGSCYKEALRDAQARLKEMDGANAEVIVQMTHAVRPIFFDEKMKEPFYQGDVMAFFAPNTWWRRDDTHGSLDRERALVPWRNGDETEDMSQFMALCEAVREGDVASDRRGWPLKTWSPEPEPQL